MQMPVAKIHVLEGQYDKTRLGKVSTAVQSGLMSALGIPPDDFFQIIHTPLFLGLKYSDDLILLEVTFISGRPKEKRLGLLKALNDGVVAAAGISPDDLMTTLYEVPGENISFGRGLAQRAHISDTNPKAADAATTRRTRDGNPWISRLAGRHQGRQRRDLDQERRTQGLSLWFQQPLRGQTRHQSRGAHRSGTRRMFHHGSVAHSRRGQAHRRAHGDHGRSLAR